MELELILTCKAIQKSKIKKEDLIKEVEDKS